MKMLSISKLCMTNILEIAMVKDVNINVSVIINNDSIAYALCFTIICNFIGFHTDLLTGLDLFTNAVLSNRQIL
jgi:hypothetical protein